MYSRGHELGQSFGGGAVLPLAFAALPPKRCVRPRQSSEFYDNGRLNFAQTLYK